LKCRFSLLSVIQVPETFLNLLGKEVNIMPRLKINFPLGLATNGLGMAIRATERALASLRATYRSLTGREAPVQPLEGAVGQQPAVPVEMSVTPDYIVCLEDGRRFKMLKGHLRASYGISPERNIAKNGACPRIIRWLPRNTAKNASAWPKTWGWAICASPKGPGRRRNFLPRDTNFLKLSCRR
jgi:predicted transcriptional regulator